MAKRAQAPDPLDEPIDVEEVESESMEEPEYAEESEDTIVDRLSALGSELQAVATDKTRRQAKLREIEALLKSVRLADFPELAESDTIRAFVDLLRPKDLRPGETRNAGTLAEQRREWTVEDLRDESRFPKVTFVPSESIPLIWNGIECYVTEGEEVSIPKPFYDLYMMRQRALRNARQHEQFLLGKSDIAPDRNWLTDSSLRFRALTKLGYGTISVGPVTGGAESTEEASEESAGAEG